MNKIVMLGAALALALAVSACSEQPGVEQYKPTAGQPADCSKYTLPVNRVACEKSESRH